MLRARPRNKWQDDLTEYGRIVGREEWQEKVYKREELKKLFRTIGNLYMNLEIRLSGRPRNR
jgi:uncharacterized protein YecE (DUF72 family)